MSPSRLWERSRLASGPRLLGWLLKVCPWPHHFTLCSFSFLVQKEALHSFVLRIFAETRQVSGAGEMAVDQTRALSPWCPHCRGAMESNAHVSDHRLSRDQAQEEKERREGVGSGVTRGDY